MRRFALTIFALMTALQLGACDEGSREVTMRIDHYLEPCDDRDLRFCLRVLDSSDPQIEGAADIVGFEHELGYVYEVLVLATDDEQGRADYDLVDVLHREPAQTDERFELRLAPEYVQRVDDDAFVLVGGTQARCASQAVCLDVARALVESQPFDVELSHRAGGTFVAHAAR